MTIRKRRLPLPATSSEYLTSDLNMRTWEGVGEDLGEDWEKSRGCNMEYAFAKGKGIPIELINH